MGVSSLVLGILSFFISATEEITILGLFLAILSIVFGSIAIANKKKRGLGIAGLVLSIFAVIMFFSTIFPNEENQNIENKNKTSYNYEETISKEDYQELCEEYTYKEIARNPDDFRGKNIVFTGEVIQVQEGIGNSVTFRVNMTKNEYGNYEDTVYCTYSYSDEDSKILEDDIIKIYGECQGDTSYTSIFGQKVTLPEIEIKYFDLIEE